MGNINNLSNSDTLDNILTRYNSIFNNSIIQKTRYEELCRQVSQINKDYSNCKLELESLIKNQRVQSLSINVFKELIDNLTQQHINQVRDLLNHALGTIFYNRNYSVEVLMSDKRNSKTAEFFLVTKEGNKVIKSSFNDSIGGGIMAVVGFVLQVFYISYLGRANIMFCDESFSQVSSEYIDSLITFIKELSKAKGFIIVLITHDLRLQTSANKIYRIDRGKVVSNGY